MRLFVGTGLPTKIGERLVRAAHGLLPAEAGKSTGVRWTRPGNLHLTLSFLGQVEPARLKPIQQSLAARLEIELGGVGAFPGILHARVRPSAPLLAFAEQVIASMERCGFPREQRPFFPHVTLARTKRKISLQPSCGDDPAFRQAFAVDEFLLYQSLTGPEGSYYEVLAAFPLQ
jgi:RNA 2',3'-cyclic 3'-phosphodiesterase